VTRSREVGLHVDAELLAAWRAGDRAAGEALFQRHYSSIARFFRNKVSDSVRDDLIQETFTATLKQAASFRGDSSFLSYILGIARHRLVDHLRRCARERRHWAGEVDMDAVSASDLGESPERSMSLHQDQRLLLEGLRRIGLNYQIALELFYWEGLSAVTVAGILDVPLGTVKTRLRDGRAALEKRLAELAASPERLASTLDNLDRWASRVKRRVPKARPGGEPDHAPEPADEDHRHGEV
jgi:RNA polymerase sigma-70 factor (ECF subfamily)